MTGPKFAQRPASTDGAETLARIEHRRLVLVTLANDDDRVHVDPVEEGPHGIDRGLIGLFLLAWLVFVADPGRRFEWWLD